jgi:hypothetical protein
MILLRHPREGEADPENQLERLFLSRIGVVQVPQLRNAKGESPLVAWWMGMMKMISISFLEME